MSTRPPHESADIPFHPNHNVYILGAGFSFDAGFPLTSNFMGVMRESLQRAPSEWVNISAESQAISAFLLFQQGGGVIDPRIKFLNIDLDNFEELYSLAASTLFVLTDAFWRNAALSIGATLDYVRKRNLKQSSASFISRLSQSTLPQGFKLDSDSNKFMCSLYDSFLSVMVGNRNAPSGEERRDTIISFNYDLLVEESLENLGIPYCYGGLGQDIANFECSGPRPDMYQMSSFSDQLPEETIRIIKLHGSTNWMINPYQNVKDGETTGQPRQTYSPLLIVKDRYKDLWELSPRERTNESSHSPLLLITPPTWNKRLREFGSPLSRVWTAATESLSTATRIIIIGYSLPFTDPHFRYLLGAGLYGNISLEKIIFVNPSLAQEHEEKEEMEKRISSLIKKDLKDNGTVELIGKKVFDFFSNPDNRKKINRNFPRRFEDVVLERMNNS